MTPTAFLLLAAAVATARSRRVPGLVPAASALCALLLLDVYHHACRPLLDAWRTVASLSSAEAWALRLDAWIMAGWWCATIAWLLTYGDEQSLLVRSGDDMGPPILRSGTNADRRSMATAKETIPLFLIYGLVAIAIARIWPTTWMPLLVAPRFAVCALAWVTSRKAESAFAARPFPGSSLPLLRFAAPSRAFRRLTAGWSGDPPNDDRSVPPSRLIGQIIAACQVGAAAFLWSRWGDVRILSSACWAACAWIAWRAQPLRNAATAAGP